jgi:hypothetical protein
MNYIIGGGPAGLVFAFLNMDFKVIDKNPFGQLKSKYQLGPRLIQTGLNTEILIKNLLQKPVEVATAFVGYEYEDGRVDPFLTDEFRRKYSFLTRGTYDYESTFLSAGQNQIEHYVFLNSKNSYLYLFEMIYDILKSRNQIIENKIESINTETKMISMDDYKQFSYDNLVSTVSLKILKKLLKNSSELDNIDLSTKNKNFYVTNAPFDGIYSYIYSIMGDYTRRTHIDDYVVYESEQPRQQEAIYNHQVVYKMENLPIQIVKSANIETVSDIHMLGRYAQWSHKVKLEEVIEQSLKIMKKIYG